MWCVCACVWTSVCVENLSVYVDISLYTCKCVCVDICVCVCVCVCGHLSVYTCKCVSVWTSVCMYVHVCLSVCEHQSVYQWWQNGVGWWGWRVFSLPNGGEGGAEPP